MVNSSSSAGTGECGSTVFRASVSAANKLGALLSISVAPSPVFCKKSLRFIGGVSLLMSSGSTELYPEGVKKPRDIRRILLSLIRACDQLVRAPSNEVNAGFENPVGRF